VLGGRMGEAIRAVLLGFSCIGVTPRDGLADGVATIHPPTAVSRR
jgi:hypothetical protein